MNEWSRIRCHRTRNTLSLERREISAALSFLGANKFSADFYCAVVVQ